MKKVRRRRINSIMSNVTGTLTFASDYRNYEQEIDTIL